MEIEGEPQAMEVENSSTEMGLQVNGSGCHVDVCERLHEMVAGDSVEFDSWASLILEIENTHADDIEMISLAYDSFLSNFPSCHWYWRKYAYHKARLCSIAKAVEIFERAVGSATFSVGLWLDYCTFSQTTFKEPSDVRRIYERGISFVGKDYFCHALWDKYMQFEFSQQQWGILPQLYIQILRFPTKKLHFYYDNFQKFVAVLEEEIRCQNTCSTEVDLQDIPSVSVKMSKVEISQVIKDLGNLSDGTLRYRALHKYKTIGDQFYQRALELDENIKTFEAKIRRRYFQARPLDDDELKNWHQYLDFIEKQDDFDWALKLYERCLISCANYPEFWIRYVEFMETKRGRPLAIFALDRATKIFLKNVPEIHLFSARFREKIGDANGARNAYACCNVGSDAYYTDNVVRQANMEKRLGNLNAATEIYEKALKTTVDQQKVHILPRLYIHFSRLKYAITGSVRAARDVIVDGIQQLPSCKLLFEELMQLAMMHGGAKHISVIESLVAKAISHDSHAFGGFNTKDKVDISCLFLEFVDLCGSLDDVRRAWDRHFELFPQFIRCCSSFTESAPGNKLMTDIKEQRESNTGTLSKKLSGGLESGQGSIISEQEQLPNRNHHIQPDKVPIEKSLPKDDEIHSEERILQLSPKVAIQPGKDVDQVNLLNQDRVHESQDDALGVMESTLGAIQQQKRSVNEPAELTHDLVYQQRENISKPNESTGDFFPQSTPIPEQLQEFSRSINKHQEPDDKLGLELKMDSFENLSLNSQEKEPEGLIQIALDENHATEMISTSNENTPTDSLNLKPSTLGSPKSRPASYSAEGQNESCENKPNSSSSRSQENHAPVEVHPHLPMSPSTSENSPQGNQSIKDSVGGTSGFYEHSHDGVYQLQKSVSPQQHATAEKGHIMLPRRGSSQQFLVSPKGSPNQGQHQPVAQGNTATVEAWPANNTMQQRFQSASQSQLSSPPVSHSSPNMPQHTVHSGQKVGEMPPNEATNQMFQYQYQPQHILQQQYQQQMLQLQLPYFHLQHHHQPPYQYQQQQNQQFPPLLQHHVQQQQQFQSPTYQLQQQISYLQQAQVQVQQQASQMQLQQDQQLQQYNRSNEIAYQMQQSGYQQHPDQGHQQLLQQYQHYQQGYHQMQQPRQWEGYRQTQLLQNHQLNQQQQDAE